MCMRAHINGCESAVFACVLVKLIKKGIICQISTCIHTHIGIFSREDCNMFDKSWHAAPVCVLRVHFTQRSCSA